MTKEQLDQFKEFPDWYGNDDYQKKVDKLNDSRDLYYLRTDGVRTTDIEDVLDEIEDMASHSRDFSHELEA